MPIWRFSVGTIVSFEENEPAPKGQCCRRSTRSKPAIARRMVVLPHPEGPSRHRISPWWTVKVMCSTAGRVGSYAQEISRSSRTGETPAGSQIFLTRGRQRERACRVRIRLHRSRDDRLMAAAPILGDQQQQCRHTQQARSAGRKAPPADNTPRWLPTRREWPMCRIPTGRNRKVAGSSFIVCRNIKTQAMTKPF